MKRIRPRTLKLFVPTCGGVVCLHGLFVSQAAQQSDRNQTATQVEQLFVEKIEPTLAAKCQTCHGEDGAAGLDARSRESLLKGGNPARRRGEELVVSGLARP